MSDQSVKMGKSETNFVRNSVFFFLLFCSFFLPFSETINQSSPRDRLLTFLTRRLQTAASRTCWDT